jgi:hypothetical protein
LPRAWDSAGQSAKFNAFEHLLVGGAVDDYRRALAQPAADLEWSRGRLLLALRSAGCVFSAGRVVGDGPTGPECREARRLVQTGRDVEALALLDDLLERGVDDD